MTDQDDNYITNRTTSKTIFLKKSPDFDIKSRTCGVDFTVLGEDEDANNAKQFLMSFVDHIYEKKNCVFVYKIFHTLSLDFPFREQHEDIKPEQGYEGLTFRVDESDDFRCHINNSRDLHGNNNSVFEDFTISMIPRLADIKESFSMGYNLKFRGNIVAFLMKTANLERTELDCLILPSTFRGI